MRQFVIIGMLLIAAVARGRDKQTKDSAATAKTVVLRFIDVVYNASQPDSIDAFVHADFVDHSPGVPADARGPQWVHTQYGNTYAAFPDLRFTVDDVIAEGDEVVTRWSSHGTFTGKLGDVTGKGQKVMIQGISIMRIADGKIIESWDLVDRASMFRQVGFVLTPPAADNQGH